ncbi:DUF5008 domain-containing protein [Pedobacter metabolipauper]|uniref:Beta-propeller uncharacterized protein DUF5122 n=1 Tax=Pedobacter metabolipauper TaxID=425513 RepID=A0A4R6SQE9_9SPHI|nr:DUF5008 domain-containing protein [Pedobacter metabolipauper]TDQ06359.1 beta-propeller uncharacterized protein DUF5122 [Pedobacter metabolipauper]
MKFRIIVFAYLLLVLAGCKETEEVFDPPYQGGKEALGIKINETQLPVPAEGLPGSTVQVAATGLLPYKDKLVFMFNGEPAEVLEVTTTGIKAKVPNNASSGVTSVMVDDKIIFGPIFKVQGLIAFDPTFRVINGTNAEINQYLELPEGKYYFVGGFTNYDNKGVVVPINRIVRTSLDGDIDRTLRSGYAANGPLDGIVPLGNQFIISGSFSGYNQRTESISNITRINSNGSIDTMGIKTFRPVPKPDTIKYFPRFNGGTNSSITRLYNYQDKIIGTGNFRYYVKRTYDKSNFYQTKDTIILDSTEVRQVIRFNGDGSLDKSYRFNIAANKSLSAGNGNVTSYMHTDGSNAGKLLLFGSFTTFDDAPANYITRLNPDGTKDPGFNPGSGTNVEIGKVTYSAVTKKYMVTGRFKTYNGTVSESMAMVNLDGTIDNSFVPKAVTGGFVRGASQLSDGLIVVYGDFKKYGEYTRNGFMILKANGELAPGYNATGIFNGNISHVIETKSADGKRALLLIGSFNRFDNLQVSNIIRLIIE